MHNLCEYYKSLFHNTIITLGIYLTKINQNKEKSLYDSFFVSSLSKR